MSYKLTQTGQQVQELLNKIGNNEQSQVTNAVLYSEQALNENEKEQARKNIGAAAENQIPTGTVLYSQAQNLTDAEKNQARTNIGALGTEQLPKKVSELENDAGYTTNKGTITQIQINNDTFTPDADGKVDCGNPLEYTLLEGSFSWREPYPLVGTFCGKQNIFNNYQMLGNAFSSAQNVWTDGEDIYCPYQPYGMDYLFKLEKRTFSWILTKTNKLSGWWCGRDVWTDGTNTYLSFVPPYSQTVYNYVWNKTARTWDEKTWKGMTPTFGGYVWHANGEIYYNDGYYLTKDSSGNFTDTWAPKEWKGLTSFDGDGIWTDGTATYYSDSNGTYMLKPDTSTWIPKIWEGFTPVAGNRIWTDGTHTYYSDLDVHYVFNKEEQHWEPKHWEGIEYFSGTDIWTDGDFTYCVPYNEPYVLNPTTGGWSPKRSSALHSCNWEPDKEIDPNQQSGVVSITRDLAEIATWNLSSPGYLLVVNVDNEQRSFLSINRVVSPSDTDTPGTAVYFEDFNGFTALVVTSGGSLSYPDKIKFAIAAPQAKDVTLVGFYSAVEFSSLPSKPFTENDDITVYIQAEQELLVRRANGDGEDARSLMFFPNPLNLPNKLTGRVEYSVRVIKTPDEGRISVIQGAVNDRTYVAQLPPKNLPQSAGEIQIGKLKCAQWGVSMRHEWDTAELNSDIIDLREAFSWGKDKFVAIGKIKQEPSLFYSYDGLTWKMTNAPSRVYTNIAHDGNRFIATYTTGSITQGSYSLDGISWIDFENFTRIPEATPKTLCYGDGKFVLSTEYQSASSQSDAVPYKVWYSTDGETWLEGHTSSPGYGSIIYGNGVFVGVKRPDYVHYSTDGENWSACTFPVSSINFNDMAYENGKFVIIPDSTLNEETHTRDGYLSTDGITWTTIAMPDGKSLINNGGWNSIAGGNGFFVAITTRRATTSTDGVHWSYPQEIESFGRAVVYGGYKFITQSSTDIYYLDTRLHNTYTIEDSNVFHNSDVLFEISDSSKITPFSIEAGKIILTCDEIPTHDILYKYKATHTNQQGQLAVINHYIPDASNFVSIENQVLTESQQVQVRQNIGAGVSNFSGDYNDLTNVPTIPTKVSELDNDSGFTDNIGTITQIKINGEIKEPKPSGLIDLGNITPEPTDWTTVPITTALENGKTYVVKLDTTPYPLTAIFTMSENLDAIDANVVGGTQQGTDGASTYELKSATITVKDGKLIGLKSTNLVSSANPGTANLAYSESTFVDLGITQYHYIELLNSAGGGMSGKGVNYTAIKDTLAIDKWTTDEIHIEGEILPTTELVLVTFDDTVQHTIDKTKENTLLIGHATADELKNIGYWAFDEQSVIVNATFATDPNTNNPLQMLFIETTDAYFKYAQISTASDMVALYVYKSDSATYKAGDIVFVISAGMSATAPDWIKCNTLTPSSEFSGFPAVKFYGYEFPSDLTGTSITIDVLCTKTDSPDIRKTLLLPYVGAEDIQPGEKVHLYVYAPTEEEAQAFPMFFAAQVLTSNVPGVAPAGTVVINGGSDGSGSEPKYVFSKLFSLTTLGMAPVTYTYLNENIKLESAIKVYLNDSENIQIIDRQEGFIQFKRAKVANIPFNMEILDTEEEGLLRLFNSYIPQKVSAFQNDAKYLTAYDLDYSSPISLTKADDGTVTIGISSSSNRAFAQYSSSPTSGTLQVDKWVKESDYYVYTISDYYINYNTDVIMNVNTATTLSALSLSSNTLKIKATTKPTESIDYSYKALSTNRSGQFTIVNSYIPPMLVTETLQGAKRYKTFEDLTDCVLEAGQYDAEGKYVYCV